MSEPRQGRTPDRPNRLARETSAYLRQHRHNPVDWYAWGPEALERARGEDKPLLVSIGYSACHWCHVMERESFEDTETAELMNRLFVNVKVDREERPDVDQLYMDTVVRLTGQGGWPLTVFCTPAGRPYHAGTYFPPEPRQGLPSFRQVLQAAERVYRERRDAVEEQASRILAAVRARPQGVASGLPGVETLRTVARELLAAGDRRHGGFGRAPKFPTPANLECLLAALDALAPPERSDVLGFVVLTCREMARRGLYDQLGGGFHRYCVDEHWGIPHFEKMLYDQGQLFRVYAQTFARTGDDDLLWPVRETASWLEREMRGPEGGFHASQDADSEGVEGKYYVWTPSQVEEVLGPERGERFCRAYGVTREGNFEHGASVLWDVARAPRDDQARERAELLEARGRRVAPETDRKRLAAWNAHAIGGLAYAGSVAGDDAMLAAAQRAASFALEHLRDAEGRWQRVFNEGRAHTPAFLDDLAGLLSAFLDLHRAGAGDDWLERAREVAEELVTRFFDPEEGDFFLTPADGERLALRPRSDPDGATPHSSGLAALGLLRAGTLAGREDWLQLAARTLRTHAFALEKVPAAYPTLTRVAAWLERGIGVAVVVGPSADEATRRLARAARLSLAPEEVVLVAAPDAPRPPGLDPAWLDGREARGGRATAYLCRGVTCSAPFHDPEAFASMASPGQEDDPGRG